MTKRLMMRLLILLKIPIPMIVASESVLGDPEKNKLAEKEDKAFLVVSPL